MFPPHLHLEICSDQADDVSSSSIGVLQPRPSRFLGNFKRLFIYFVPGKVSGGNTPRFLKNPLPGLKGANVEDEVGD